MATIIKDALDYIIDEVQQSGAVMSAEVRNQISFARSTHPLAQRQSVEARSLAVWFALAQARDVPANVRLRAERLAMRSVRPNENVWQAFKRLSKGVTHNDA